MKKLDARTQKALETIGCGDTVRFYDCFEAEVYGKRTFIVQSEFPEIYKEKYVLVKLHGLGKFPIGKLKKVPTFEGDYGDNEIKEALIRCVGTDEPKCEGCPYEKEGPGVCSVKLLKDSNDYIKRIEDWRKERERK